MRNYYKLIYINIFYIIYLIASSVSLSGQVAQLQIGQLAPDFKLKGIDNKIYTLNDFSTYRILVIIFTCNHCPTTQAYEERINQLVNNFQKTGVGFVAIMPNYPDAVLWEELAYSDIGDRFDDMKKRAEEGKYTYPYLYDGDGQKVAKNYGISVLPHTMVFDEERKLRYSGWIDNVENPYVTPGSKDCQNAIEALLEGKDIKENETKSFGCLVKWESDTAWKTKVDADWAQRNISIKEINTTGIKKFTGNYTENLLLLYFWSLENETSQHFLSDMVHIHRSYNQRFVELITFDIDNSEQKNLILNVLKTNTSAVKNYIIKTNDNVSLLENLFPSWDRSLPLAVLIEPGGKVIALSSGKEVNTGDIRKKIITAIGRYYVNN